MHVLIVGAGGHGRVVLDILRSGKKYKPLGFIDADPSLHGTRVGGIEVLGGPNQLLKLRQKKIRHAIVAIGENRARQQYAQMLRDQGFALINALHPTASIAKTAKLGENVVIAAGAVVCTDATISDSAIINTSAVVDHECFVGEAAHVCPGALLAGRVRIGEQSLIGLGAKIIQCVCIGDRSIIGAGAVVIRDVPSDVTAVGVPARVIKSPLVTAAA